MLFETKGKKGNPVILFFHAMGVTGESSGRIAEYLQNEYFCIMPTSTVYCEGQKYVSKADELRQIEEFLKENDVNNLALVVASSMPAKNNPNLGLAACFQTNTLFRNRHIRLYYAVCAPRLSLKTHRNTCRQQKRRDFR